MVHRGEELLNFITVSERDSNVSLAFSSRAIEVRRQGAQLLDAVIGGDGRVDEMVRELRMLPSSEACHLSDMVVTMCQARPGRFAANTVARLHDVGAQSAMLFGLSLKDETLTHKVAPSLVRMLVGSTLHSSEVPSNKLNRYARILALAQISPRLNEEVALEALMACVFAARNDKTFDADLVLPITGFEALFREDRYDEYDTIRERTRQLCIEAVRARFEAAVDSLTDADTLSFDSVLRELPVVHAAGVGLLNLLPTIVASEDPLIEEKVKDILSSIELIVSRGEGFPGSYFHESDIGVFDQVRSLVSLSAGVLSLKDSRYTETVREMRVAKREGSHLLGTAVLHFARSKEADEAMELVDAIVRGELGLLQRSDGYRLTVIGAVELSALAWYFDLGDPMFVKAGLERVRDPRGQFYLTKALDGSPWE